MRYFDPMKETPEGKLLAIVRDIEKAVGIKKKKDGKCSHCDGEGVVGGGVRDPAGQPEPCANCVKKAEKNYECNMGCDDPKCKTCGPVKKYVQERSGDNIRPMFMEISGKTEIPAVGYQGNQVLPFTEDAPASKAINEVFKMPSVSQTGYDAKSSSMHMHYNDGGNSDYRAKVEESLADIKKEANAGQLGLIEEIAGKIEQLYARL